MAINLEAVEWYDKTSRSTRDNRDPQITVNRSGRVGMNSAAMRLLGEVPDAFTVGYLRDGNYIVLRPASHDDSDSYRVAQQGRNYYINTKRFLEGVGFRTEKISRFPAQYDEKSNVLYFSLNDVIHEQPPKSKRGRPRKHQDVT